MNRQFFIKTITFSSILVAGLVAQPTQALAAAATICASLKSIAEDAKQSFAHLRGAQFSQEQADSNPPAIVTAYAVATAPPGTTACHVETWSFVGSGKVLSYYICKWPGGSDVHRAFAILNSQIEACFGKDDDNDIDDDLGMAHLHGAGADFATSIVKFLHGDDLAYPYVKMTVNVRNR